MKSAHPFTLNIHLFVLEAEQEAKRKRIEARLNASIGGKTEKPKPAGEQKPKSKSEKTLPPKCHGKDEVKTEFKKEKRKEKEHRHEHKNEGSSKEKHKHIEKQKADMKLDKHKNEHRKEKDRTEKHVKKKKSANENNNSGLSFMDLMKLAKSNSENPGSGAVQKKEMQQKIAKQKVEDVPYDPDRHLKIKRKHKEPPLTKPPPTKHSKLDIDSKKNDKRKDVARPSDKKQSVMQKDKNRQPQKIASKDICRSEIAEKPKHGLLVETVSVSKNQSVRGIQGQNGNKPKVLSKDKGIYAQYRGGGGAPLKRKGDGGIAAQNRVGDGIAAQNRGGGIAAQNKGYRNQSKIKKKAEDYEDEFEKEARELARKRKLFEMRRLTGIHLFFN